MDGNGEDQGEPKASDLAAQANKAIHSVPADEISQVAQAAIQRAIDKAPDDQKTDVVNAVVASVPDDQIAQVAQAAIQQAVDKAPSGDEVDVVRAVAQALPADGRAEVVRSMAAQVSNRDKASVVWAMTKDMSPKEVADLRSAMPQNSVDRRWLFITGFVVAGVTVIALSAIAAFAPKHNPETAHSIMLLATAFTSALLGGLMGALKP